MYKAIADLIGNDYKTIYRWKKEDRKIVEFFEKYFTKEELEEFLKKGYVDKLESIIAIEDFSFSLHSTIFDKILQIEPNEFYRKILQDFKEKIEIINKSNFIVFLSQDYLEIYIEEFNESLYYCLEDIEDIEDFDNIKLEYKNVLKSIIDGIQELSEREFRYVVQNSNKMPILSKQAYDFISMF